MMWSVVMLSPTFSVSSAFSASPIGRPSGTALMFGPRRISTSAALSGGAGGRMALSSTRKRSGMRTSSAPGPRLRGSVISPVSAAATAVSGETR